ncbi:hypothetical protein CKA32_006766 [Geitlerinema sp. FC II]|nr:hypothetical protein CKA32_006766 [Geitlerinema sp. FC II]
MLYAKTLVSLRYRGFKGFNKFAQAIAPHVDRNANKPRPSRAG